MDPCWKRDSNLCASVCFQIENMWQQNGIFARHNSSYSPQVILRPTSNSQTVFDHSIADTLTRQEALEDDRWPMSSIPQDSLWCLFLWLNQEFATYQIHARVITCICWFLQLLWVNLIMDTLGALALETEPPTENLMHQPPCYFDDNPFGYPPFVGFPNLKLTMPNICKLTL